MATHSDLVVDVSAESFDVEVLERSHDVPVLVDFWAPWCGPCRMLGPVLENIVVELGGRFILAKANTEANPGLGQRFGVSSIPACKFFVDGNVVGEFVGAISGTQVRRFVETHLPTEADKLVAAARAHLRDGDREHAQTLLAQAIDLDEAQPDARLMLARIALRLRDAAGVETHLDAIHPGSDAWLASDPVRDAARFIAACETGGGETAARARLEADPADLDARYALGCCLALDERWEEALQTLLESVIADRKYADAAARKAMVTIFDLVGRKTDLSDTYVRKLMLYA